MKPITLTSHIAAPPPVVFEVFTDLEHAADRIEAIKQLEVLTDGPVGVGTRFRETRVMFGKEATEEMEITDFEQNTYYALGAESCGMSYNTEFRFELDGENTKVEMVFSAQPVTMVAKLLSPLGGLMKKACMKAFKQDLEDLKLATEQKTQTQPASISG